MRFAAVEPDQHAKAARVDGLDPGLARELLERGMGDQRDGAALRERAAGLAHLDEPERPAEVSGECVRPGPGDEPAVNDARTGKLGGHRLAELDDPVDGPTVGEGDDEAARRLVPAGGEVRQLPRARQRVAAAVRVDEDEAPVLAFAARLELELVALLQREATHRADREPRDVRHYKGSTASPTRMRPGPTTSP